MTVSRRLLASLAGWVAIVAVGSTLVWTVVAHAGRDVGDPDRDTVAASSGTEPTVGPSSPGPPTGAAEPSPTPTGSTDPSPTATPSGSTGSSPTPDATEDGDPPASSSPPPPQSHRKTWQGAAGTVTASCSGAKISLVAAQPNSGWRVEVGDRGPEELSVKFELTEGEDDDRTAARSSARALLEEVEVHAHCSGGVPTFAADG